MAVGGHADMAAGRRAADVRLQPHGNTAQIDEKAAKLVCAAALAGGDDRPLVLILDELGRNLGKQHRREAVALFERIGRDRNITVIGALQDDMERYAIEASDLYIKLRRSSDAIPYNEAPVVIGDDTTAPASGCSSGGCLPSAPRRSRTGSTAANPTTR